MATNGSPAGERMNRRRWTRPKEGPVQGRRLKALAQAAPGEILQVEEVVFGTVKEYCQQVGIGMGTRLVCRACQRPAAVEVETSRGDSVEMPTDLAHFVWVRELPQDLEA